MLTLVSAPRKEIMQCFDALPPRIRRAIAKAGFPYDPRDIAERLAKGRRLDVVARSIERRAAP